jgi:hypothetical protein
MYSQVHESFAIKDFVSARSIPQGIVFLKDNFVSKLIKS